jgi:ribose transport system substrate-binding protein
MQSKARQYGLNLDVQGASSESDTAGQVAVIEEMIRKGYDALLVSPQTDDNLVASVDKAQDAGIRVVNVDDAVLARAEHFVGPNQYENGVRAARYIIGRKPEGGKVAVIEGQAGVYAAKRRTLGFKNTMAGTKFTVVASVSGDWDLQKSLDVSADLLRRHPDIVGFYCNNDIMALGTVEAGRQAGGLGKVIIIGTDGIQPAYASIRAGGLTATVDSFPYATGQVAVDVALRLLGDQKLPRVVFSPQNLVTKENVDHPMPG